MDETLGTAILVMATGLFVGVFFRVVWVLDKGRRHLVRKYAVSEDEIQLLDTWTWGLFRARVGSTSDLQSDSDCWAPCTDGVAFARGTGFCTRYQHFVVPWSDVVCSIDSDPTSKRHGCVAFHFEDIQEDFLIHPTKKMLQILNEHNVTE